VIEIGTKEEVPKELVRTTKKGKRRKALAAFDTTVRGEGEDKKSKDFS